VGLYRGGRPAKQVAADVGFPRYRGLSPLRPADFLFRQQTSLSRFRLGPVAPIPSPFVYSWRERLYLLRLATATGPRRRTRAAAAADRGATQRCCDESPRRDGGSDTPINLQIPRESAHAHLPFPVHRME
jgi:hypothetical protein